MTTGISSPVVVVGGGVMGFCSALQLLERGFGDVTLVAEKFSGIPSKTTAGIFRPDYLGDTDPEKVVRWGLATRKHYQTLHRKFGCDASGVACTTHMEIYRQKGNEGAEDPGPIIPRVMDGFRAMTPFEIATHFPSADGGWTYSTFVVEGARYMPWLRERAESLGLRVIQRRVEGGLPGTKAFCEAAASIAERPACTTIVNCCGVHGGTECKNVRGQFVLVRAPYVKLALGEYSPKDRTAPTYIIPRKNHVVLGCTYLYDDDDTEVRDETSEDIIARCAEWVPEIASAPVIGEVVCLRPGRKEGVRLDTERVGKFSVISCYGHGGAGMSLAWGCGEEVAQRAAAALIPNNHASSRL